MSDDASKTLSGGVRAWLGSGGFLVMMFGGYFIYDNNNLRVGIPMIVGGLILFILPWVWDYIVARIRADRAPKRLEYLHFQEVSVGGAIRDIATYSAWAKWFASQYLTMNEHKAVSQHQMMQIASSLFQDALVNGTLLAKGRPANAVEYEDIPKDAWQLIVILMRPHPASLWQGVIQPNAKVSADRVAKYLSYDSITVDAHKVEELWPKRSREHDKLRKKLLKKAIKVGADLEVVKRLRDGDMATWP